MSVDVRPCTSPTSCADAIGVIGQYFGSPMTEEGAERFLHWIDLDRMHGAFDGDEIVGGAGAFSFDVSVPGGADVPGAGVTVIGVLPTDRRRGVLTRLMRAQLDDCRARGEPLAYLWASEGTIYGRVRLRARVARRCRSRCRASARAFALPFEPRGAVRFVTLERRRRSSRRSTSAFAATGPGCSRARRPGGRRVACSDDPTAARPGRSTARCSSSTASRPATRSTASRRTGRAASRRPR